MPCTGDSSIWKRITSKLPVASRRSPSIRDGAKSRYNPPVRLNGITVPFACIALPVRSSVDPVTAAFITSTVDWVVLPLTADVAACPDVPVAACPGIPRSPALDGTVLTRTAEMVVPPPLAGAASATAPGGATVNTVVLTSRAVAIALPSVALFRIAGPSATVPRTWAKGKRAMDILLGEPAAWRQGNVTTRVLRMEAEKAESQLDVLLCATHSTLPGPICLCGHLDLVCISFVVHATPPAAPYMHHATPLPRPCLSVELRVAPLRSSTDRQPAAERLCSGVGMVSSPVARDGGHGRAA